MKTFLDYLKKVEERVILNQLENGPDYRETDHIYDFSKDEDEDEDEVESIHNDDDDIDLDKKIDEDEDEDEDEDIDLDQQSDLDYHMDFLHHADFDEVIEEEVFQECNLCTDIKKLDTEITKRGCCANSYFCNDCLANPKWKNKDQCPFCQRILIE